MPEKDYTWYEEVASFDPATLPHLTDLKVRRDRNTAAYDAFRKDRGDGVVPGVLEVRAFSLGMQVSKDDENKVGQNLAMCIRVLCHKLKKADPANEYPAKALDLLERFNLQGSPLRDAAEG